MTKAQRVKKMESILDETIENYDAAADGQDKVDALIIIQTQLNNIAIYQQFLNMQKAITSN
jgi:hypothetical protein